MRCRSTKAKNYLIPGVHGLLYCNPLHAFMVPFVVTSPADLDAVVKDVWPEPWVLPFAIRPLGDPRRKTSQESAMAHWPILIRRQEERGIKSVTAALNI